MHPNPKDLLTPCRSADELHLWVRLFTGLDIPREAVCPHHDAPFEYLRQAYFEPAEDMIVHAPRGGGKTRLAALATLLDLLHKPGCAVRILGGSLEQSLKMWEHLVPDIQRLAGDLIESRIAQSRRLRLSTGSNASVLTQSQRAVRGLRVQKLRCDEVELFDPDVWEAAQLVTRSRQRGVGGGQQQRQEFAAKDEPVAAPASPAAICPLPAGGTNPTTRCLPPAAYCNGTIEALSTHHRPFGLMQRLLDAAAELGRPRIVRWCLLEVLQRCEPARDCATCALWNDCRGVAKTRCSGFIPIDDAIALKRRVSEDCWNAEMLCRRPSVRGCVFPMFDVQTHVGEGWEANNGEQRAGSDWKLRSDECRGGECAAPPRSRLMPPHSPPTTGHSALVALDASLHLSLDFGFANPFVCLWIRRHADGRIFVIDEYVQAQQTLDVHLSHIQSKGYGTVSWLACDPAGTGRSDQTAASNVTLLRRAGYRVRYRASRIVDGIELIRAALRPAAGPPRLRVHPRCVRLIAALRGYRYPDATARAGELPLKDGEHDHLVDALRYFFVNDIERKVVVSNY